MGFQFIFLAQKIIICSTVRHIGVLFSWAPIAPSTSLDLAYIASLLCQLSNFALFFREGRFLMLGYGNVFPYPYMVPSELSVAVLDERRIACLTTQFLCCPHKTISVNLVPKCLTKVIVNPCMDNIHCIFVCMA